MEERRLIRQTRHKAKVGEECQPSANVSATSPLRVTRGPGATVEGTKLFANPVEMDILTRRSFAGRGIATDWPPDLLLELPRRNIIAKEFVIAVEATRVQNLIAAVAKSTADAGRVAPHHLGEVAPCSIVVRVVVRVLGLLLMPAVGGRVGKLEPLVITARSWLHRREIAAQAVVLGFIGALCNICSRSIGKTCIPDEVLSTVNATPIPMGSHYNADEVGVVRTGGGIVDEVAGLDIIGWSSYYCGSHKSDKCSEELHDELRT